MRILVATGNLGKMREIEHEIRVAGLRAWQISPLSGLPPIAAVEEDRPTFIGNAIKKARFYAQHSGWLTLADDSGLCVDALDGRPGVHSARYAGVPCNDAANNARLLDDLADVEYPQRTARFVCALALASPTATIAAVQAQVAGLILSSPRGQHGFGYDPLFLLPALDLTTAELPMEKKSVLSHRGQAIRNMLTLLQNGIAEMLPQG